MPPSGSHANQFSVTIPVLWYGSYGNVSSPRVWEERGVLFGGGMPKGRNKWAAELYIKRSSLVSPGSLGLAGARSEFRGGLERARKDLSHHRQNSRNPLFGSAEKTSWRQQARFPILEKSTNGLFTLHLIVLAFVPRFAMATSTDTLPAHLLPLVMEEFPQPLATACVCRAGRQEPRFRCLQCGIIEEEEDCSSLEEDQAQRSFLQTLESLRRSTR